MTTSSLFGNDPTSMAHFSFGIFCHSSCQNVSRTTRMDGECLCTYIFRSLQRCSIGFRSGLSHFHFLKTIPLFYWQYALGHCPVGHVPWELLDVFLYPPFRLSWQVSQSTLQQNIPTAWWNRIFKFFYLNNIKHWKYLFLLCHGVLFVHWL